MDWEVVPPLLRSLVLRIKERDVLLHVSCIVRPLRPVLVHEEFEHVVTVREHCINVLVFHVVFFKFSMFFVIIIIMALDAGCLFFVVFVIVLVVFVIVIFAIVGVLKGTVNVLSKSLFFFKFKIIVIDACVGKP